MSMRPAPELIDKENPEWEPEEFAKARPFPEVLAEQFGNKTAQAMIRPPGAAQSGANQGAGEPAHRCGHAAGVEGDR